MQSRQSQRFYRYSRGLERNKMKLLKSRGQLEIKRYGEGIGESRVREQADAGH